MTRVRHAARRSSIDEHQAPPPSVPCCAAPLGASRCALAASASRSCSRYRAIVLRQALGWGLGAGGWGLVAPIPGTPGILCIKNPTHLDALDLAKSASELSHTCCVKTATDLCQLPRPWPLSRSLLCARSARRAHKRRMCMRWLAHTPASFPVECRHSARPESLRSCSCVVRCLPDGDHPAVTQQPAASSQQPAASSQQRAMG
jgi:hypothetical protein